MISATIDGMDQLDWRMQKRCSGCPYSTCTLQTTSPFTIHRCCDQVLCQSDQMATFVSGVDGCSLMICSNAEELLTASLLSQATSIAGSRYTIVDIVGACLVNQQHSPEGISSVDIEFEFNPNLSDIVQVFVSSSVADGSSGCSTQNICKYLMRCSDTLRAQHLDLTAHDCQNIGLDGKHNKKRPSCL